MKLLLSSVSFLASVIATFAGTQTMYLTRATAEPLTAPRQSQLRRRVIQWLIFPRQNAITLTTGGSAANR